MTITKPVPWAYNPALTRLPAISALLGVAYPLWEGAGEAFKEVVGDTDLVASSIVAYPSTTSYPTFTSPATNGGSLANFIRLIGHGASFADATDYFAKFYPTLTQEESDLITDPANRYILMAPSGADFTVKPAPYAWTIAGLDSRVQSLMTNKCKFFAPLWEGTGLPVDLISGTLASVGMNLHWINTVTGDGVTEFIGKVGLIAQNVNEVADWDDPAVTANTSDPNYTILHARFQVPGGAQSWSVQLYPYTSSGAFAGDTSNGLHRFYIDTSEPGNEISGPFQGFFLELPSLVVNLSDNIIAMSITALGVAGAWSVNGAHPPSPSNVWVAPSGLAGLSPVLLPNAPTSPGIGLLRSQGELVLILRGLERVPNNGDYPNEVFNIWDTIMWEGNWIWVGQTKHDDQDVFEVELAFVDAANPANNEYTQVQIVLPDEFFDDGAEAHVLAIKAVSHRVYRVLGDGVVLDQQTAYQESQWATEGDPFSDPPVAFGQMIFGTMPAPFVLHGLFGFPTSPSDQQDAALAADPFGPVAPAEAGGGAGPIRRRRRRVLLAQR